MRHTLDSTDSRLLLTITSFGNNIFLVARRSLACSSMESSQSEFPILFPLAFNKVFVIPPPVITSFDTCIRLFITSNFEDTFEPPTIDRVGVSLECIAFVNAFTSSSNKSPAHEVLDDWIAPKVEA